MKFFKRSVAIAFCVAAVLTLPLFGADPAGVPLVENPAPSRVFAVNLWSAPIDLKLGQDGIFVTSSLAANMASQMVVFRSVNPRAILYKASSAETWVDTRQAEGKSLAYAIQGGKTYLILVQANGVPGLYELAAADSPGAKIAVFNASEQTLPVLQIGSGFNQGPVVEASDLAPGWTNFADVPDGKFGAFWTYRSMPTGVGYFYTAGRDGKSLGLTAFNAGGWYVAVIWNDNARNQSGGTIWDITSK